jgi:hypothetical protein
MSFKVKGIGSALFWSSGTAELGFLTHANLLQRIHTVDVEGLDIYLVRVVG